MNWFDHQVGLLIFYGIVLLILLTNLLEFRPLSRYQTRSRTPFVSILVPARDEEINIESCLRSLLAQDYPAFEVLVLDDASSDQTPRILQGLAAESPRLRVLIGQPLPESWLGKHWACHQLVEAARGEILLFTDADVRHQPQALTNAICAMEQERADMLTALPREEVITLGEQLTVPLFGWSFLAFQPLLLIHHSRIPGISVAVGQFMLFRREALQRIGGFAAVRGDVADDLALARRIRNAGLRLRVVDGTRRVTCRMYRSFPQAFAGFSKNLFAAFRYRLPLFLFVWLFLPYALLSPLCVLLVTAGHDPALTIVSAFGSGCAFLLWAIPLWRLRFPWYLPFLYPLILVMAVIMALRSAHLTLRGQGIWKGRILQVDRRRRP